MLFYMFVTVNQSHVQTETMTVETVGSNSKRYPTSFVDFSGFNTI